MLVFVWRGVASKIVMPIATKNGTSHTPTPANKNQQEELTDLRIRCKVFTTCCVSALSLGAFLAVAPKPDVLLEGGILASSNWVIQLYLSEWGTQAF